jgi:hypothetical protein
VTEETDLYQPATLVVEYNSTSLIFRGVLSIILIIVLLVTADALTNFIAVAALGIWFVLSLFWIKKAYKDKALVITDFGIKIHDKDNIKWKNIINFFIKTIVDDVSKGEILVIKTDIRNFEFEMRDLNVDRERLDRWIKFYKLKLK